MVAIPTTATTANEKTKYSFISKFNSVSNGCTFAALKEHITTCLQRWRHTKERGHQKKNCGCFSGKWLNKINEFTIFSSTKKTFTKFQKVTSNATNHQDQHPITIASEGPRRYGRKVEIVAKLLSVSLVGTAEASTTTADSVTTLEDYHSQRRDSADSAFHSIRDYHFQSFLTSTTTEAAEGVDEMTITDLTMLEIRDEHPDLDSEIRSILTTYAQGATIAEIRNEYRKLTGRQFPIYEGITDFLLTIPYVSVYCNEHGTRIFSVRPMEKTKHIQNMVIEQKPPQDPAYKSFNNHRRYFRQRQRNSNYYPQNWRLNASYKRQQQQQQNQPEKPKLPNADMAKLTEDNFKQAQTVSEDNNLSRDDSEGFVENNWCYQDNCHYLYNRICNPESNAVVTSQVVLRAADLGQVDQQQHPRPVPQPLGDIPLPPPPYSMDYNNMNINAAPFTYENNINHLNNLYRLQQDHQIHSNNIIPLNPRHSSVVPSKMSLPRSSRNSSPAAKSSFTNDSMFTENDYEAHLLDFLLLGDDFLLFMARMELRCKFKKHQKVLQSGLCVSGQTINAAIRRISQCNEKGRSIIVNIGSVDIMQGRQLIQSQHEFRELIKTMLKQGIKPILTTLAPLANYAHHIEMKKTLQRFNEFIKREGQRKNLIVIDIWDCLVNDKQVVRFDCYQNEPRKVTGANEPYLFWNNIGRQRVLQLIESQLEY